MGGEGGELLSHKFVAKKLCSIEESFKNFKSRSTLKELMHKFMHKMGRINSSRKVFQNAPNSIRAYLDFQIFPGRMPPTPLLKRASGPFKMGVYVNLSEILRGLKKG